MRRLVLLGVATLAIVLMTGGVAFANFGPHGGYVDDTDACAACHRAHTSFSTLGWVDFQGEQRDTALLVSDASTMTEFCYACHGDAAIGASTNVESGVFDTGPTSGVGTPLPGQPDQTFVSYSSYDATLNGGGFSQVGASVDVASSHGMEQSNAPVWGETVATLVSFRCTSCHDPHGSSNYRLLKDALFNGAVVGGYDAGDNPQPYVISNEYGYPQGGWKKGTDGVAQMALYRPSYTSEQWAYNPGKSMSAWCSGCHTGYNEATSTANYAAYEEFVDSDNTSMGAYVGARTRHRHLVDVPLSMGQGSGRGLTVELEMDTGLPLEMGKITATRTAGEYYAEVPWDESGNVTCLTCHFAHGSSAEMTGWAVAKLSYSTTSGAIAPVKITDGSIDGVNPNFTQSLLRYDNRGVCERCHNKG